MSKRGTFLNFEVPDEMAELIDDAAAKSGLDRSKQCRALLAFALGYEQRPYIPAARALELPFQAPTHEASSQKSRRRMKVATR